MVKEKVPRKLTFKISTKWDGESGGVAFLYKSEKEVFFDIPKDFGGKGRYPCPDEIFLVSLTSCLMNTFLYIAKRRYLRYVKDIEMQASCRIELNEKNEYSVKKIELTVVTYTSKKYFQALKYLWEIAYEYCHILKIVKKVVDVVFKVKFIEKENE